MSGRNSFTDKGLALDWSCASLEFRAYCKGRVTGAVYAAACDAFYDCLYMSVYADGRLFGPREKNAVTGTGEREFVLADGLPEGVHDFKIIRQSESETGEFCIKSISLDGYLLPPPERSDLYIEFIGDSITTGTGNLYTPECGADINPTAKCYQDGTRTYAYLAAKRLGADVSITAQQGIGIICGWQPHTTLETYEMTCYQRGRCDKWNFARKPDITVINLSSNDFDKLEEYGKTENDLKAGAVKLSRIVRSHYPDTAVVWAYGMIGQQMCGVLSDAVKELGGESEGFYFLKMESDSSGGGGHPALGGHSRNAERLYEFLKYVIKERGIRPKEDK